MAATTLPAVPVLDVKPYLPRNTDNPISAAEQLRDSIYDQLTTLCHEAGLVAMIAKSPPYSPEAWVRLEIWRHAAEAGRITGRSHAIIMIEPKPFHRFPQELKLTVEAWGRKWQYGPLAPLAPDALGELVHCVAGSTTRPKLHLTRLRTAALQLWRPKNKLVTVRPDYLLWTWVTCAIIGAVAYVTGPGLSGTLLLVAAGVGGIYWWREPRLTLSTGRPAQEPRNLIRMDSWQTVLRGLAETESRFHAKLLRELEQSRPAEATCTTENIWYWGVDNKEERRQIVVTFRRAVAFVHVYAYHRDLYVGWDSHVNCGSWTEFVVGRGIDRATGQRVVARSIRSAWHIPNEYDITDANYLAEWIHAVVVERVKEIVAEHNLTQELDFTILREERRAVVGTERPEKRGGRRVRTLLKRTG